MELPVASAIGVLTAGGLYPILPLRTFSVAVGTALLSCAVNLFLFGSGRLAPDMPPILAPRARHTPIRCRRRWCSRRSGSPSG